MDVLYVIVIIFLISLAAVAMSHNNTILQEDSLLRKSPRKTMQTVHLLANPTLVPTTVPSTQWYAIKNITVPSSCNFNNGCGFGWSMAFDGSVLVVGAPFYDSVAGTSYEGVGAIYFYNWNGFEFSYASTLPATSVSAITCTTTSSSSTYGCGFGQSLAISSNTVLAIGAPFASEYGYVLLYQLQSATTYSFVNNVPPYTSTSVAYFGSALAVNPAGGTAIIGAAEYNLGTGEALVYTTTTTTWKFYKVISSPCSGKCYFFGCSAAYTATDGSQAMIGAYGGPVGKQTAVGSVYVYDTSTWTKTATISDPAASNYDLFGSSIAYNPDGAYVLIGAPGYGNYNGIIYAYYFDSTTSTWQSYNSVVFPVAPSSSRYFGSSIVFSPLYDLLLIGASAGSYSVPTQTPNGEFNPTSRPTSRPTSHPSSTFPSSRPTSRPTSHPSSHPSTSPSSEPSSQPTSHPSSQPSSEPSLHPSSHPSTSPSSEPSSQPSSHPAAVPSTGPITAPSSVPTSRPSPCPTSCPSTTPSSRPTAKPSSFPTHSENNIFISQLCSTTTNTGTTATCTFTNLGTGFSSSNAELYLSVSILSYSNGGGTVTINIGDNSATSSVEADATTSYPCNPPNSCGNNVPFYECLPNIPVASSVSSSQGGSITLTAIFTKGGVTPADCILSQAQAYFFLNLTLSSFPQPTASPTETPTDSQPSGNSGNSRDAPVEITFFEIQGAAYYICVATSIVYVALAYYWVKLHKKGKHIVQMSSFWSCAECALYGFSFASEVIAMYIYFKDKSTYLALGVLIGRLLHIFPVALVILRIFGPNSWTARYIDKLDKQSFYLYVQSYVTTLILASFESTMLKFLPWKATDFAEFSEGYPDLQLFKICLVTKFVQSILNITLQALFLVSQFRELDQGDQIFLIFSLFSAVMIFIYSTIGWFIQLRILMETRGTMFSTRSKDSSLSDYKDSNMQMVNFSVAPSAVSNPISGALSGPHSTPNGSDRGSEFGTNPIHVDGLNGNVNL